MGLKREKREKRRERAKEESRNKSNILEEETIIYGIERGVKEETNHTSERMEQKEKINS